jgi:hypothetical protein
MISFWKQAFSVFFSRRFDGCHRSDASPDFSLGTFSSSMATVPANVHVRCGQAD